MKKIIFSLLTVSLTQNVFSYDLKDNSNQLCNNEAKLTYFWNNEKNQCQSEFKIKEANISVANENGVFIIKSDQGETVNGAFKKAHKKLDIKYKLNSCDGNQSSCFVKSETGKKNEKRLQVHNQQNLEAFPTKDRGSSDFAFKIKFEEINCQGENTPSAIRLIIRDPKNKIMTALATESFKIDETGIDTESKCKKLNQKKQNSNNKRSPSPPAKQQPSRNNSQTNT